jgi:hypothetical protein
MAVRWGGRGRRRGRWRGRRRRKGNIGQIGSRTFGMGATDIEREATGKIRVTWWVTANNGGGGVAVAMAVAVEETMQYGTVQYSTVRSRDLSFVVSRCSLLVARCCSCLQIKLAVDGSAITPQSQPCTYGPPSQMESSVRYAHTAHQFQWPGVRRLFNLLAVINLQNCGKGGVGS